MLTLSKLKEKLMEKSSVSLAELAKTFQTDPVDIQHMMNHFIKKESVIEKRLTKHCGSSCQQCPVNETILYQWKLDSRE